MPVSAAKVFSGLLSQLASGAIRGKLSFGAVITFWAASSGIAASITALNIAFEVPCGRSWWRRRLIAMALTVGIGVIVAASLLFLLTGSFAASTIIGRLPILVSLTQLSNLVRRVVGLALLWLSLDLIYGFGPNLNRKSWEGVLPGACFALGCWLVASYCLRFYLASFGSLRNYGSLAGVVALLFWLYLSAAALLLGGELNAIIWHASRRSASQIKKLSENCPKGSI
jgi:membrane protein